MGAAGRTGVGLGVEAPVGRIVVLGLAGLAHPEIPHGRPRTVIGDIFDDGEPRSAVRAVDEGISVPPVPGIEQLGEAVLAGGMIRRQKLVGLQAVAAFEDPEPFVAVKKALFDPDPVYASQRRRPHAKVRNEALHLVRRAGHLDLDPS